MQRRQILRIAITIISTLAILWIAGGWMEHQRNEAYNRCMILNQEQPSTDETPKRNCQKILEELE